MHLPSFQDTPIETSEEDTMGIGTYTKSLTKFITSCQAPMTIGLQGNWGTGKTSLMKLLESELKDNGVHSIWVNTWEHSVFVDAEQTTPQILLAMAEQLKSLKKKDDVSSSEKAKTTAEDLFFVGKNALNQFVSKNLGIDFQKAKEEEHHSVKTSPVARIRSTMSNLVTNVVGSEKNTTEKVVFFIDDLDRIKPSVAVDVIEALKNVFDEIPHCVFILAIDYEVIKKGLIARYGNQQNADREFKSFFDKMIQVPFRMPTAAMNVKGFIETHLKQLGIDGKDKYFEKYASVLMTSIGHNPRSLKRFFNTYSLQQNIMHNITIESDKSVNRSDTNFLLALLNAFEIAFPKSWGLFLENHEIDNWVEEVAEWKEEDRKELLAELNLERSVLDERDQNGVLDFVSHDKAPALFQELKKLLDDLSKAANSNLDEVLSIVKITSNDDEATSKDFAKKARAEVSLEDHFEKSRLDNDVYKSKFTDLIDSLKESENVECKVALNLCSVKKAGYKNSIYLRAQKSKISFSIAAISDNDGRRVKQTFGEFLDRQPSWKVKHYTNGCWHMTGDFAYDTDTGEVVNALIDIVELHANELQKVT